VLKNQHIIVTHVSRRTGIRKARTAAQAHRRRADARESTFLMDFEGAREGGEVEDLGPPPAENAE
jgi:hypothetical protein